MTSMTLKILDILKTEFNEQQSLKIAEVVDTAITELKNDEAIATKLYVNEIEKDIKSELAEIRQDIAVIKTTMTTLATKDELNNLRNEMHQMKYDMIKWMVTLMSINTIAIISAMLAIVKFVK